MVRRTLTAALLLVIVVPAVLMGGAAYAFLVAAFVGMAAWEYVAMFRQREYQPSAAILVAAVLLIILTRAFWTNLSGPVFTLSVLAAMVFHLLRFERGRQLAALDLVITLGGMVYMGWVAAYFIDLRALPDGAWWLLLVFIIVWVADAMAYFVGVRFGNHKMLARLSPKKSWEGYLSGIVAGTLVAGLLAVLAGQSGILRLDLWRTLGLGLVLSSLTTLGDLGESLFKRFAGMKDSGSFLPGHGGAFDRIDSLIWAGVLGYFWIRYLML
ncbi:MAG TPA: phosphatidate cytidylyltransferase [Anaerolineales bacterium]|nr:phosphatidate cytidylyltransferase [Anaerolineales bacterium]